MTNGHARSRMATTAPAPASRTRPACAARWSTRRTPSPPGRLDHVPTLCTDRRHGEEVQRDHRSAASRGPASVATRRGRRRAASDGGRRRDPRRASTSQRAATMARQAPIRTNISCRARAPNASARPARAASWPVPVDGEARDERLRAAPMETAYASDTSRKQRAGEAMSATRRRTSLPRARLSTDEQGRRCRPRARRRRSPATRSAASRRSARGRDPYSKRQQRLRRRAEEAPRAAPRQRSARSRGRYDWRIGPDRTATSNGPEPPCERDDDGDGSRDRRRGEPARGRITDGGRWSRGASDTQYPVLAVVFGPPAQHGIRLADAGPRPRVVDRHARVQRGPHPRADVCRHPPRPRGPRDPRRRRVEGRDGRRSPGSWASRSSSTARTAATAATRRPATTGRSSGAPTSS